MSRIISVFLPYLSETIRKVFNTTNFWNDFLLNHVGLLLHKSGPNSRVPLQFSPSSGMNPIKLRPSGFLSPFPHIIDTFSMRKKSCRTTPRHLLFCLMLAGHTSSQMMTSQSVRTEEILCTDQQTRSLLQLSLAYLTCSYWCGVW